ncbi:hypothetical protein Tco_0940733, partial [Tanacetum coccineum]
DTIQLKTAVSTTSSEYLLEFTSEYGITEELHSELPSPGDRIMDFPEGKVEERVFPIVVDWRISAPMDKMPVAGFYSPEDVVVLNTCRNPIQKQHEALLCLVGLSRRYFLRDDVYPMFLNDDDREMDLFNLISALNPTKVKTGKYANAPPKVLRKDHDALRPTQSTIGEKSTRLDTGSTLSAPTPADETPADVSDPDPLSYAKPRSIPEREIAQEDRPVAGNKLRKSPSFYILYRVANGIYQPGWGVTNSCRLESPDVCQDVVDHIVSPRLRFEQEVWLLKRATKKVAKRDQRIQAREGEIKKLDQEIYSLKSADTEAAEAKNVELAKKLESLCAKFLDLQVNNTQLSQQVSSLQAQITGEERIKAAFEEFKRYEDDKVEQRCAEMDARLYKLSIDFNEELYPHMLTAIAGHHWLIGHGLRLAVLKCTESPEIRQAFADVESAGLAKGMSEGLQYGIEHGKAGRDLGDAEAYDPEANDKFVKALQDLKDLKYPIVDQVESSSQLKIPIYPEVCNPKDPWAVKEELSLEDAIAANISQAEKKKICRVVCHTHSVGSAHHARSNGVAILVSTAAPQGLAFLVTDAAT